MPTKPRKIIVQSRDASPDRMQRVRVGMTGLASVALLIVVTTAIASGVQRRVTIAHAPIATPAANAAAASEPLAQLGAAPGAASTDEHKAPAPPPAK